MAKNFWEMLTNLTKTFLLDLNTTLFRKIQILQDISANSLALRE